MTTTNNVLHHFSYPLVTAAMEENMIAYMKYCSCIPGTQIHTADDHMSACTGIAQPSLNVVMRSRFSLQEVEQRVTEILTPFKERHLPMSWWIFPGTQPANLAEYLEQQDLFYRGKDPGMAIELYTLPDICIPPPGVTIAEVQDSETLMEWIQISAIAFGSNPAKIDTEYMHFEQTLGLGTHRPYRRFLARLNGTPVATSALFLGAGVAGLFSVGTIPAARKRGIGTAISLAPLLVARQEGYHISVLQSSSAGYRVYFHMGFRECCRIKSYIWYPE